MTKDQFIDTIERHDTKALANIARPWTFSIYGICLSFIESSGEVLFGTRQPVRYKCSNVDHLSEILLVAKNIHESIIKCGGISLPPMLYRYKNIMIEPIGPWSGHTNNARRRPLIWITYHIYADSDLDPGVCIDGITRQVILGEARDLSLIPTITRENGGLYRRKGQFLIADCKGSYYVRNSVAIDLETMNPYYSTDVGVWLKKVVCPFPAMPGDSHAIKLLLDIDNIVL